MSKRYTLCDEYQNVVTATIQPATECIPTKKGKK